MAERRMFAKSIINSARFLQMPSTSRLLYYDLGMAADDDGVVEAFSVMRLTVATEDDLKVLSANGFVKVLNEDLVTYITDWSRNNYIQKDRYHPSVYQKLLVEIQADTDCIQDVSRMDTQSSLGKSSLGKASLGKESVGEDTPPTRSHFVPPTLEEVTAFVKERGSKVDPQGFIDYYAARGWMTGRTPIRDWKAVCRSAESWERWDKTPAASDRDRLRTEADYGDDHFFA